MVRVQSSLRKLLVKRDQTDFTPKTVGIILHFRFMINCDPDFGYRGKLKPILVHKTSLDGVFSGQGF